MSRRLAWGSSWRWPWRLAPRPPCPSGLSPQRQWRDRCRCRPLTLATRWQIDEAISAASRRRRGSGARMGAIGCRDLAATRAAAGRNRLHSLVCRLLDATMAGLAPGLVQAGRRGGQVAPEQRLAVYLATEYQERVLDAVAAENDPRRCARCGDRDLRRRWPTDCGRSPVLKASRRISSTAACGDSRHRPQGRRRRKRRRSTSWSMPDRSPRCRPTLPLGDRLPIEGAGHCCPGARVGPLAQRTREQLGPRLAASGGPARPPPSSGALPE